MRSRGIVLIPCFLLFAGSTGAWAQGYTDQSVYAQLYKSASNIQGSSACEYYPTGYVQDQSSDLMSSLLSSTFGTAAGGFLGYSLGGVVGALLGGLSGYFTGQSMTDMFVSPGATDDEQAIDWLAGYDNGLYTADTLSAQTPYYGDSSGSSADNYYSPYYSSLSNDTSWLSTDSCGQTTESLDFTFYPVYSTEASSPSAPRGSTDRAGHTSRKQKFLERYDSNRDGQLDASELEIAQADRVKRLDADQDGTVSEDERTALVARRSTKDGGSDLEASRKEYGTALRNWEETLKAGDTNGIEAARTAMEQARRLYMLKKKEGLGSR